MSSLCRIFGLTEIQLPTVSISVSGEGQTLCNYFDVSVPR